MPERGQVVLYRGQPVTLQSPHPIDSSIWIAVYGNGSQALINGQWADEQIRRSMQTSIPAPAPAVLVITSSLDGIHALAIQDDIDRDFGLALIEYNQRQPVFTDPIIGVAMPAHDQVPIPEPVVAMATIPAQPPTPAPARSRPRACPGCQVVYTGDIREHGCARINTVTCGHCNEVNLELLSAPLQVNYLCGRCVQDGFFFCKKCRSITNNNQYQDICNGCNRAFLSERSIWYRHPQAKGNDVIVHTRSHRPYAVEIESFLLPEESDNERGTLSGWEEAQDGSIRPDAGSTQSVEFRSPAFRGDGGLKMLLADAKKIRAMGFRANRSCGLHVHVNALDTTHLDRMALFKFGKWIQEDIFKFVAPVRSSTSYCKKLGRSYNRNDRYFWLNLSAFERHRTVEYRLHHGTTNAERITEWVKVCLKITEVGMRLGNLSRRPRGTIFQLLGFNDYEINYWTTIAKSLHGNSVTFGDTAATSEFVAGTESDRGIE